jgi:ubiquinone/menaquinone biosynthesis C-methylase UbiE
MRGTADYLLPRTEREARRLDLQSELLREGTERLLGAIGLRAGMTCLDVGCGTGHAMELIAAHVGPSGQVVGLDLDAAPSRARIERLRAAGGSLEVIEGDLLAAATLGDRTFDLTFSRYVMHHLSDPAAAIARMWERTRPGGVLAVLDIDQRGTTTYPVWPPYEEVERLIRELYRKTGIDNHIGHKLPHLFERAGVGAPDGTQVTGVIRTIAELGEFLPLLLDMIRDKLLEHSIATAADVDRLAAQLATAIDQPAMYCYRPSLVGVWRRKR